MKKFAVFGNPIAHSLSPVIHQMFANACGEVISYEKVLVPLDEFEPTIGRFFAQADAVGCNVTVPFKTRAFDMAVTTDEEAKAAKAVNTLIIDGHGNFQGFNTDGVGLVADLFANNVALEGKRVMLIGAGGAARGAIHPLLNSGVSALGLTNRTVEKANAIVDEIGSERLEGISNAALAEWLPDIVINSTSASLHNALPAVEAGVFRQCQVAYDMAYAKEPTIFMRYARENGCHLALDGLGMLVEQAAASFKIWTGKSPATREVLSVVRSDYAKQL